MLKNAKSFILYKIKEVTNMYAEIKNLKNDLQQEVASMYFKIKNLKNDLQQELDHIASQISAIGTDLDCLEERYAKLDDLLSFIEQWEEVDE
jgi:predicted  nucleic acid-binding Zn-ribbon protein